MDRGKNLGNTSLGKIIKERVERRPLEEKVRWSSQNWKEESTGDIKKPISFFFFFFLRGDAVGCLNAVVAPRIMTTDQFRNNGIVRLSNF